MKTSWTTFVAPNWASSEKPANHENEREGLAVARVKLGKVEGNRVLTRRGRPLKPAGLSRDFFRRQAFYFSDTGKDCACDIAPFASSQPPLPSPLTDDEPQAASEEALSPGGQ